MSLEFAFVVERGQPVDAVHRTSGQPFETSGSDFDAASTCRPAPVDAAAATPPHR